MHIQEASGSCPYHPSRKAWSQLCSLNHLRPARVVVMAAALHLTTLAVGLCWPSSWEGMWRHALLYNLKSRRATWVLCWTLFDSPISYIRPNSTYTSTRNFAGRSDDFMIWDSKWRSGKSLSYSSRMSAVNWTAPQITQLSLDNPCLPLGCPWCWTLVSWS